MRICVGVDGWVSGWGSGGVCECRSVTSPRGKDASYDRVEFFFLPYEEIFLTDGALRDYPTRHALSSLSLQT